MADCLVSVLLAPACAACGLPLLCPTAGPVCADCWHAVRPAATPVRIPHVDISRAAGDYAGTLRGIILALKYGRRTSVATRLAQLISAHCHDALRGADVAVPVPLHRARQRERGFNQAALLAHALPLPYADALVRRRPTISQTDLPADKRRANVKGAFAIRNTWEPFPFVAFLGKMGTVPIDGKCVVLVDDVTTTGATLSECATVLKGAGAREVRAVTAARAR